MTQPQPDAEALKTFNAGIADEFRANAGKVGGHSTATSCCC
jgi:hypothetical protein